MNFRQLITKAGLVIISILLSLFIAEVVLRFIYPDSAKYYVWQPNLQHTFTPDSTILYGIRGKKNFTINKQGLRGEVLEADNNNYIFLGGSTTECLYLDDHETWWWLWDSLQSLNDPKFLSASLGKSGITTRELYLHMKYVVPSLPNHFKTVVVMPGLNDLMKRLSKDSLYDADFEFTYEVEDSLTRTVFLQNKEQNIAPWWRRTALFRLVQRFYHAFKPNGVEWMIQDDNGNSINQWRFNRTHASDVRGILPDMTTALREYERNLELIRQEAKKQELDLIFITQPTIYKDSMSEFEGRVLWMGGVGAYQKQPGHAYYSAKALKLGMDLYNETLIRFCTDNYIQYFDAANKLKSDTSIFYDDCHFNENGAREMAKYLNNIMKD
jgi:hypothetical protein